MGRGGGGGDFEEQEARAARAFAQMCAAEGVGRVVYLGGLGDKPGSKHLRSRGATARELEEHGPPLTYFRAGMVVGPGSESYRTLRHLVARLPVMIAPRWLSTPTQPIDIDDVVSYLAERAGRRRARPAARCRSARPTCCPTRRCSTAWRSPSAAATGRGSPSRC